MHLQARHVTKLPRHNELLDVTQVTVTACARAPFPLCICHESEVPVDIFPGPAKHSDLVAAVPPPRLSHLLAEGVGVSTF